MRIKTVVSIIVDGTMYFRMNCGVCYWTDNLAQAKFYSGKAKAKISEVKNYIIQSLESGEPHNRPRMYIYSKGNWSGFQDEDAVWLNEYHIRTIKLHQVLFDIREL